MHVGTIGCGVPQHAAAGQTHIAKCCYMNPAVRGPEQFGGMSFGMPPLPMLFNSIAKEALPPPKKNDLH